MQASMGLALGTVEDIAHESLVVSHLSGEFHAVYAAIQGGFIDRSRETGIGMQTRPFTGFGVALADCNCDGMNEVLTVNGRVSRPDHMNRTTLTFGLHSGSGNGTRSLLADELE